MTTIEKKTMVTEDRRVHLEFTVPEDFPIGQADVLVLIAPDVESEPLIPLSELAGSLKDSPNFSDDPMEIQRKIRDDVW
ncbi:MAG: hypothetical protein LBK52_06555 [Deltaproteobacteria bacterium]|jgi:hypothetical protein|nr:hypothetical protein [Deltaproteobacteria bacterium]